MTRFDDLFQTAPIGVLNESFGRSVTRNYFQGGTASATARWSPEGIDEGFYEDGEQQTRRGVLRASPADWPNPDPRDTVTIDAETYAILAIDRRTPAVEMRLERRTQTRIGGAHSVVAPRG